MKCKIILLTLIGSIALFASEDLQNNTNNITNRQISDISTTDTENVTQMNNIEELNGNQIDKNEIQKTNQEEEIEVTGDNEIDKNEIQKTNQQEEIEVRGDNQIVRLYTEEEEQTMYSIGICMYCTQFLQQTMNSLQQVELQEISLLYTPLFLNIPLTETTLIQYLAYQIAYAMDSLYTIRVVRFENFIICFRNQRPIYVLVGLMFSIFMLYICYPLILNDLQLEPILMSFVGILFTLSAYLEITPNYTILQVL